MDFIQKIFDRERAQELSTAFANETLDRIVAAEHRQGLAKRDCRCVKKNDLSISGDPSLKGAPTGHVLKVREVRASVGAGFVYPICGDMRTMPGLGAHPAAHRIDLDENGRVTGLF